MLVCFLRGYFLWQLMRWPASKLFPALEYELRHHFFSSELLSRTNSPIRMENGIIFNANWAWAWRSPSLIIVKSNFAWIFLRNLQEFFKLSTSIQGFSSLYLHIWVFLIRMMIRGIRWRVLLYLKWSKSPFYIQIRSLKDS